LLQLPDAIIIPIGALKKGDLLMPEQRPIMIFPIIPDRNVVCSNNDEEEKNPSLRGYLATRDTSASSVPILTLKSVFRQIAQLPPGDLEDCPSFTGNIARELLMQGKWTWQLPELISDISTYMQQFTEDRLELENVRQEMNSRLNPIFTEARIENTILISDLIDQIIAVFSSCNSRISLQEISSRLQDTPAFSNLPEEVVDHCVDEFFAILFSRGYISFVDD